MSTGFSISGEVEEFYFEDDGGRPEEYKYTPAGEGRIRIYYMESGVKTYYSRDGG
jgi:hypothetical protein